MSEESQAEPSTSPAGLELSDEFKTFLMSHKDEVMRLLKANSSSSSKNSIEKKIKDSSSSESESSMPRRRRDSASSDDCDSDVVVVKRSEERSRSRSRTPHSPVRYIRREHRERSDSRSRSRSRSSTPARYERHIRRLSRESGRGRGYGRGAGAHYSTHHHPASSYHPPHYGPHPHRGDDGYQNYETGARRGGFIRMRNAMEDGRDNPTPSKCLGVFGMPPWVREYDMRNIFEPYGEIDQLNVVINRNTGQCRGYGFVYFSTVEEAKRARSAMRDAKIDGIPIRVDFSVTDQRRPSSRDARDS